MNTNDHDIVVARVLGNYNPPKSSPCARLKELAYILEAEKGINFKRIWILNRVFDLDYLEKIKSLLQKFRHDYIEIPFKYDEYKLLETTENKFNYSSNINNARNRAISEGLRRGKYLFCLDGDCFFTPNLFGVICKNLKYRERDFPYYALMTKRIPLDLDEPNLDAMIDSEPMLIFTKNSEKAFDEDLAFGQNDKNELCWKLGFSKEQMSSFIYESKVSGDLCKVLGDVYHVSFSDPNIEIDRLLRKDVRNKAKGATAKLVRTYYEGNN